jgi:ureidoacrylate peracid hydrolase
MRRGKGASRFLCAASSIAVQATTRLGSTLRPFRRRRGCERASNTARGGGEIRPGFEPKAGDIVATEHWCSSGFANTDLDLQLKKHGIHQLIVIGLIAHTCIEATVRFAAELGYEVTVVRDATADYSDEEMHAALDINIPNYASAIVSTTEVVDSISSVSKMMATGPG